MTDGSRIRVLGHVFVWVRLVGAGEGGERIGLPVNFDPRAMQPDSFFNFRIPPEVLMI